MKENKKIIEFIKTHKKEIAIAIVVGAAAVPAGVIGYKCHISKNYGELFKLMHNFDPDKNTGATTYQTIVKFLENATDSVNPLTPNVARTIKDILSEEIVSVFVEDGFTGDELISGILVGLKKN